MKSGGTSPSRFEMTVGNDDGKVFEMLLAVQGDDGLGWMEEGKNKS